MCIRDSRGAIPTIPIPPPDKMLFAIDDTAGTVTLSFALDPSYGGDLVYIFNLTRGDASDGGVVDTAGAFTSEPFPGQREDQIDILFRRIYGNGDDAFGDVCLMLRDPPLDFNDLCPY